MLKNTITVTVQLEGSFWTALFERNDAGNYTVARKIFGKEPTDPELYEFLLKNYHELKYTEPQKFKLIIKRKNPKRVRREVRKAMEKGSKTLPSESHAQEVLRLELEKNKKTRQVASKTEKEAERDRKFLLRQVKKKKKQQGH